MPTGPDRTAELAFALIDHVKRTVTPEAALQADRIAAALAYMDKVESPNTHTLTHIRGFLTGTHDSLVALWVPDHNEES